MDCLHIYIKKSINSNNTNNYEIYCNNSNCYNIKNCENNYNFNNINYDINNTIIYKDL